MAGRLASAHTIPREFADQDYIWDAKRFQELRTPTLLLTGRDSPPFLKTASEVIDAVLPNSRLVVMPGQAHIAMTTAPGLFAEEVLRFLLAPLGDIGLEPDRTVSLT